MFILFVKDAKDAVGFEPFYKVGPVTFIVVIICINRLQQQYL